MNREEGEEQEGQRAGHLGSRCPQKENFHFVYQAKEKMRTKDPILPARSRVPQRISLWASLSHVREDVKTRECGF